MRRGWDGHRGSWGDLAIDLDRIGDLGGARGGARAGRSGQHGAASAAPFKGGALFRHRPTNRRDVNLPRRKALQRELHRVRAHLRLQPSPRPTRPMQDRAGPPDDTYRRPQLDEAPRERSRRPPGQTTGVGPSGRAANPPPAGHCAQGNFIGQERLSPPGDLQEVWTGQAGAAPPIHRKWKEQKLP